MTCQREARTADKLLSVGVGLGRAAVGDMDEFAIEWLDAKPTIETA
jgi:hypothetical protein